MTTAAELGYQDAARLITIQHAAGVPLDQIQAHHADTASSLFSDAQTEPGRDYASSYDDTARTLVADLRQDAAAATRETPAPGTRHPDERLAAKGWQACESGCGVYVRKEAQREAG